MSNIFDIDDLPNTAAIGVPQTSIEVETEDHSKFHGAAK
jgi:hypothetical protein